LKNVEETAASGLCISCEICRAICPEDAIVMKLQGGQYVPLVDDEECSGCGSCIEICPGLNLDPHGLVSEGIPNEANLAGKITECLAAKLKDGELLEKTASGGVVTGMILGLLEQGKYDFASILKGVGSNPQAPRLVLTDNPEEIVTATKSKYVPVSAYNIVRALTERENERFIIIATPCVLDGILGYARINDIDLERVLLIGLFCELTMNLNFIEYIKKTYGKPGEGIELLDYRNKLAGGWPGHMRITFTGGRTVAIDRSKRMELKPYFQLRRCLLCTDKLNRAADISVGDCYIEGHEDREGKSSIIIRTEKGRKAFLDCESAFYTRPSELRQICLSQGINKIQKRAANIAVVERKDGGVSNRKAPVFLDNVFLNSEKKRIRWGEEMNASRIWLDIRTHQIEAKAKKVSKYALAALVLSWRIIVDTPSALLGTTRNKSVGKTTGIIGANFQNRGAQAMALTVIDQLRSNDPAADILLLVDNYEKEKSRWSDFRVELLPWNIYVKLLLLCPMRFRARLAKMLGFGELQKGMSDYEDLGKFVDVSGYALSSKWGKIGSLSYIVNIMVAKRLKAAIELLPQSFGPWDYPKYAKAILFPLFHLYLRYPTKICAREELSRRYIMTFSKNVELSPDIVLTNRGYNELNILRPGVKLNKLSVQEGLVGIIPNTQVFRRMDSNTFFLFYDAAVRLLTEKNLRVLLLWYSDEDRVLCETIYQRNEKHNIIEGIEGNLNTIEAEHLISQLSFIISSRYHSVVHAYKNSVPAVVVGWAHKYESLLQTFGQMDYLLSLEDDVDEETARNMLEEMIDNREQEKKNIGYILENINAGVDSSPSIF